MTLKQLALPLYFYYRYLKYFKKFYKPIGFSKTIWCLRKGIFTKNFILYDLQNNNPSLYVTDYQENFRISRINQFTKLVNDKILFTKIASSVVDMPAIKGIFDGGSFMPYASESCSDVESFLKYIKSSKGVIFKPIDGDGGEGIFLVTYSGNNYRVNQREVSEDQLRDYIRKINFYYASDLIQQNEYAAKMYPHSVNTIRFLTFVDPETKKPFIGAVAHRIGNDISRPVDNCAKGGITAAIDIENGILSKGVRTYYEGEVPTWYSNHPDTNSPIEGVKVPGWENIKKQILELAEMFSLLPLIGWDVVLLPNGNITVIEANTGADLKLHQVHSPLLQDEKIKRFFNYYSVLNNYQ